MRAFVRLHGALCYTLLLSTQQFRQVHLNVPLSHVKKKWGKYTALIVVCITLFYFTFSCVITRK